MCDLQQTTVNCDTEFTIAVFRTVFVYVLFFFYCTYLDCYRNLEISFSNFKFGTYSAFKLL